MCEQSFDEDGNLSVTRNHFTDPAAHDLINGDRILAAASNKAMAFNKATKAAVRLLDNDHIGFRQQL